MNKLIKTGYLTLNLESILESSNSLNKSIYDSIKKEYEDPFIIKNRERLSLILEGHYNSRNSHVIGQTIRKLTDEVWAKTKQNYHNEGDEPISIQLFPNTDPEDRTDSTFLKVIKCLHKNFEYHQELYNHLDKRKIQMWYENRLEDDGSNGVYNTFKKITEEIVKKYYDISKENIDTRQIRETYYNINCHIEPHEDGRNEKRLCVVLMYLSNNYEDGMGGEFNITETMDNGTYIKLETVTPEFGNIVVLDFTENNKSHSVSKVLKDYGRNALITFVYKK